ncbi:MAG: hypothetical protein HOE66_05275 [Planctomycetes bacterium]|nr:hypothetical protein [Planctomycetota bacterium]
MALMPALPQEVGRVHSRLMFEGDVLWYEWADVTGDGLSDLLLARLDANDKRQLDVFEQRQGGAFPAEPDRTIAIHKSFVAWGVGEFRPEEAGLEILFLTAQNARSFSPRKTTYRGNLKKIVDAPMLLDLPSKHAFPLFEAIAHIDGDAVDDFALVTRTGYQVVSGLGAVLGEIEVKKEIERRPMASASLGGARAVVHAERLADLFVPSEHIGELAEPMLLHASETLPQPMLADADGDGRVDLLWYKLGQIYVHLQASQPDADTGFTFASEPSFSVKVPTKDWTLSDLRLVHAGGSDAVDLLITRAQDSSLSFTQDWQSALFIDALNKEGGLGRPTAFASLKASFLNSVLRDLNGDGQLDLGLSSWSLSLAKMGLEGVEAVHKVALYFADEQGQFPSRASTTWKREYNINDITALTIVPALDADFDGDGLVDLFEPDPNGAIEVRSLRKRGSKMRFSSSATWQAKVDALAALVEVEDINQDSVGDLLVIHEDTVETFVSRKL